MKWKFKQLSRARIGDDQTCLRNWEPAKNRCLKIKKNGNSLLHTEGAAGTLSELQEALVAVHEQIVSLEGQNDIEEEIMARALLSEWWARDNRGGVLPSIVRA